MKNSRFRDHLAPLKIATWQMPDRLRSSAVHLSYKIGKHKTAHLFGVAPSTITCWRRRLAEEAKYMQMAS